MAHLKVPVRHRSNVRTTNLLERSFVEERRRTKVIEVKWIEMLRELDSESKLNRDPQFIQRMMSYGEDQAEAFLNRELTGGVGWRTG